MSPLAARLLFRSSSELAIVTTSCATRRAFRIVDKLTLISGIIEPFVVVRGTRGGGRRARARRGRLINHDATRTPHSRICREYVLIRAVLVRDHDTKRLVVILTRPRRKRKRRHDRCWLLSTRCKA